jgi:hypothetical protein
VAAAPAAPRAPQERGRSRRSIAARWASPSRTRARPRTA